MKSKLELAEVFMGKLKKEPTIMEFTKIIGFKHKRSELLLEARNITLVLQPFLVNP